MKTNTIHFVLFALFSMLIACNSPESASSLADATLDEEMSIEITSRSVETKNGAEDRHLLLARKWQSSTGELYLDLKIDGTFEGIIDGENVVHGTWDTADNEKTLQLTGDHAEEGKGNHFAGATYTVLEMASESIKMQDESGNILTFVASK